MNKSIQSEQEKRRRKLNCQKKKKKKRKRKKELFMETIKYWCLNMLPQLYELNHVSSGTLIKMRKTHTVNRRTQSGGCLHFAQKSLSNWNDCDLNDKIVSGNQNVIRHVGEQETSGKGSRCATNLLQPWRLKKRETTKRKEKWLQNTQANDRKTVKQTREAIEWLQ